MRPRVQSPLCHRHSASSHFRNSYTRRRKLSHNDADIKADFVDDLGDRWVEYEVFHHNIREYLEAHDTKGSRLLLSQTRLTGKIEFGPSCNSKAHRPFNQFYH